MTALQRLMMILIASLITVLLRALPFMLFPNGKQPPRFIIWLGARLPRAVMALLVVYCLKDLSFTAVSGYLPALVSVAVTALLHVWKKKMVLSICGGTLLYMMLIRFL